MGEIKISSSSLCHLWNKADISPEDLRQDLSMEQIYEDDSHLMRKLMKCKKCGQLYFYEFYEEIDWSEGNDPQYRTWIPVEDAESARALHALSIFEILKFPSIRSDWPRDQKEVRTYRQKNHMNGS
jgi:hypothetical protein